MTNTFGQDTVNINGPGKEKNTFDAIVIGSGMSGGWAAEELCEKGLKTLVLERGRNLGHIKDYPAATMDPWQFPHRNQLPRDVISANPIVSKCYAFHEEDRKSTRLNSSHVKISYAVFCLKKKINLQHT